MAAPKGNKFAIGNNGGRPPIYACAEELIEACEGYFNHILGEFHNETVTTKNPETGEFETKEVKVWDRFPEPATVTGLSLYLGFADKCSLDDYEKKEEYSHIIKKARTLVEHGYEKCLFGDKPTGAIFALKNMRWKDKTEVDNNVVVSSQVFKIGGQEITM